MRNQIYIALGISLVVGIVLYLAGIYVPELTGISVAAEPILCLGGKLDGVHCTEGTILPITNSLIMTILVVDVLLLLTCLFGARNMTLIPRGFQNVVEVMVEGFYNFAQSVDRKNVAKFFPLCATIFFFVLYSNLFALFPFVGSVGNCVTESHGEETSAQSTEHGATTDPHSSEAKETGTTFFSGWPAYCGPEVGHVVPYLRSPSADLNVTLAIALIAVFMVEFFGFQALGLGYLGKFFNFREGALMALVGILEFISEFVRIIAFAFRLFGNIFAGEVVLLVMSYLIPYLLPLPFYGLELFVAFMQAVIFSVLTLIFMSLAVQAHGGHDHEHDHGHSTPIPVEAPHGH